MITVAGIGFILAAADLPTAPQSGSSQSAVVALIVGISSALVAVYSIVRQARGDRSAEKAAASTVAHEASKQSFEQIMVTVKFQAEQIIGLQKANAEREIQIDRLEEQVAAAEDELGKSKRDNARLRRLVREHGGTP